MFETDYSKVDPGLLEKVKGLESRLREASGNGRLTHGANCILGVMLNVVYGLARWAACGNAEKVARDRAELDRSMERAARFLSENGY